MKWKTSGAEWREVEDSGNCVDKVEGVGIRVDEVEDIGRCMDKVEDIRS